MSRANVTSFESVPVVHPVHPSQLYVAPPMQQLRSDMRIAAKSSIVTTEPPSDATRWHRAVTPSVSLSFGLVTDEGGLLELEADWNDLFERAGRSTQVFQTFSWNWHWCRHFVWNAASGHQPLPDQIAPKQAIRIVTARDDNGRLVMVWPLAMERLGAVRQIVWMGDPVSQYGDILADTDTVDQAAIGTGWAFMIKALKPDVVRLRRVRADAIIAPLLAGLTSLETVINEAPHLDLTSAADFATYEQRYSAKARKNRRRLARRLEELGAVTFARLSGCPEAGRAAHDAVEMKQSWLRERGLLSPALADPRFAVFMSDIAAAAERTAGVTVSVLNLNNAPVGIQIGVIAKKRLSLHVIVYDLAYEKSGVGVLHLEHTIADAYDQGLIAIDLLAPKAEYKMDWADGTVAVIDHAVPVSVIGKLYAHVYLGFVRERAKSLVQRLPSRFSRHLVSRH